MKKIYTYTFLFSLVIFYSVNVNGTVWNVTANSSSFSPNSLPNVVCGDTVRWTYGSGNPHTTTSTTIPSGAPTWNAAISSSSTTFQYVVPNFAGVYNYKCTPHNFFGSFTVSCSVGIDETQENISSSVCPNPFSSQLTLENHDADAVRITNAMGQVVAAMPLNTSGSKSEINLDALAPGIYFLTTLKEGVIRETKRIVKIK